MQTGYFIAARARPSVNSISLLPRRLGALFFAAMLGAAVLAHPSSLSAQDATASPDAAEDNSGAVIIPGSIAVTGFSGNSFPNQGLPPGVDPIDKTFINAEGRSLQLLDVSDLGAAAPASTVEVPDRLTVKAKDIGQVFGVSIHKFADEEPTRIFAAATSLYGLQIVTERDGELVRLVNGEPGARWMPGQFGTEKSGGPGSIWEIDRQTGEASLFADVMSGANANAGPGLGALAFDPVSKHIYVPNLESGHVHVIDAAGQTVATFDHGADGRTKAGLSSVTYDASERMSIDHPSFSVEQPSTWGFADKKRLVFGVAVQNNRLYYSVAEGPQIWSVGLQDVGGFVDDARIEIDLGGHAFENIVTGIAFDDAGDIYLAQRGKIAASYDYGTLAHPQDSSVLHFLWDEAANGWWNAADEFAISQRPPHRASNGGVGLGFGYNKSGKIDTGACQATLWVTGDNLNEPEDGKAVNGLQAMSISQGQARADTVSDVLPELDAPTSAWMIDFDGQSLGNDEYGHVGALAVYAPDCGSTDDDARPNAVAEADSGPGSGSGYSWPDVDPEFAPPGGFPELPPIPLPDAGTEEIEIAKSCAPAAIGGVIKCTITVENTGTEPLSEAVVVSDDTIIAAGPGAGGSMQVSAVTPDGPEWTCTATPTVNLTCGLPPEHLPPGTLREFVVDIDTSTMLADGNVGFSNCASLGAPYVGVACDNGGTDITVKKTAQNATCTDGLLCGFTVEITNNSSQPFAGQLQLTDIAFQTGGGAPILTTPVVVTGDLGCAAGNPAQISFSCQAAAALAAGETRSYDLAVMIPPAPPNNYWLRNCFIVTEPGNIPSIATIQETLAGGAVGGTLGTGGAMGCAWVKIGNPPPVSNLKVVKTATEKCSKDPSDPNNVKCEFNIAITNTGPADFNGPINILEETKFATATVISNDPNWVVTGPAPPGTFALNPDPAAGGAVSIPADPASNTITIPVSVVVPQTDVEAAADACRVSNTATILSPVWPPSNDNYDNTDDLGWAVGDASLLEFDGGGAAIILCDPTNLKTTKVAKGPCKKAGGNWRCEFEVTVENMGRDPYKGNIEIVDTLNIGAVSVSHSDAKWAKVPMSPSSNRFTYLRSNWPDGTMAVGAKAKLDVTVDIPDGEYCSLSNTAKMTFPTLDRHNSDKTDDEAMATAKIPRPECKRPPQCKPKADEFRTESGACACKKNYTRGRDGACVPDEPDSQTEPEDTAEYDDLRVTKTGPASCEPDSECTFEITVAHTGSGNFNGRAAIVDGITTADGSVLDGARIVSIEPPLGCDTEPTRLPFGCVANVELGPREAVTHRVTVRMPDAPTQSGPVSMRNCAMVNMPDVLDADVDEVVGNANDNRSTPSSLRTGCHDFEVVKEEAEQCTNGMVLNSSGLCECPEGTDWNGRRCFGEPSETPGSDQDTFTPETPNPVCPADWDRFNEFRGQPLGYHLENVESNGETIICGEPRCETGWRLYRNGSAIPGGWKRRIIGRANSKYKFWCARPPRGCKPGRNEIKLNGTCVCRDGYDRNYSGVCVRTVVPPPPTCKPGRNEIKVNGDCVCRARHHRNKKGVCVPDKRPPSTCKPGRNEIKLNGDCVCRARHHRNRKGVCVPDKQPPPTCKPGRNEIKLNGDCVCRAGHHRNRKGVCVPDKRPPPTCKPGRNEIKLNGDCVCRARHHRNKKGKCVPDKQPPLNCWKGWTKISSTQIRSYRKNGYYIRTRGPKGSGIVCARKAPGSGGNSGSGTSVPPQGPDSSGTGDPPTAIGCKGGKPYLNARTKKWSCSCGSGKTPVKIGRNRFECRGSSSGSGGSTGGGTSDPRPPCYGGTLSNQFEFGWICNCPKGAKRVAIGRKGGARCVGGNSGGNGGTAKSCEQIGKVGKWPKCRDKQKKTCKQIGKVGKWPKCRDKQKKTCKQIGKVGKWPKCRDKQKKTCKQIGKVGKWPKCRDKKKKTCKQFGKVGKWPKCKPRKKAGGKKLPKSSKSGTRKGPKKKGGGNKKAKCKALGLKGKWPNCKPK